MCAKKPTVGAELRRDCLQFTTTRDRFGYVRTEKSDSSFALRRGKKDGKVGECGKVRECVRYAVVTHRIAPRSGSPHKDGQEKKMERKR